MEQEQGEKARKKKEMGSTHFWDGHLRRRSNKWMAFRRWPPVWRQATPTCHSQMSSSGRWTRTWSSVNICLSISKPDERRVRRRSSTCCQGSPWSSSHSDSDSVYTLQHFKCSFGWRWFACAPSNRLHQEIWACGAPAASVCFGKAPCYRTLWGQRGRGKVLPGFNSPC